MSGPAGRHGSGSPICLHQNISQGRASSGHFQDLDAMASTAHPVARSLDRLVALRGPRHHGLARQCVGRKHMTKTIPGHKNLI